MSLLRSLTASLPDVTLTAVIDILLVAFLIYQALVIVRGTRAWHILIGILTVGGIYYISEWFQLDTLHGLLSQLVPYAGFAIIVLFQSEIRRTLARIGRRRLLSLGYRRAEHTEDILLAINRLSHEKTGALVVMERDIGLRTFIESGVRLDAHVSRDLLLSIFHPGSALHDGSVIVRKDRVAAAACFLPLSTNPALSSKLGTRHRAAIGITEETDCLALVVSEETGRISVAAFGEMESGLTMHELEDRIAAHFGARKFRKRPGDGLALRASEPVSREPEKVTRQ
jgi:diadenylate cyclase